LGLLKSSQRKKVKEHKQKKKARRIKQGEKSYLIKQRNVVNMLAIHTGPKQGEGKGKQEKKTGSPGSDCIKEVAGYQGCLQRKG